LDIQVSGQLVVPSGAAARNPAFDITPARLLSAIVTENGLVLPPFSEDLARVVRGNLG